MSSYLTKHLKPLVRWNDSMLDLCCGPCMPTKDVECRTKIGVDLNPEVMAEAGKYCIPMLADVGKIGEIFRPKSFDVVMWLDGIEHLENDAAVEALGVAEKIAKRMIVVFTPVDKVFFDLEDEFLRHRSFFPTSFWTERGYDTASFKTGGCFGRTEPIHMVLAVKRFK